MLEVGSEAGGSVSELVQRHRGPGEEAVTALFELVERFSLLAVTQSLRGVVGADALTPEPPPVVVVHTLPNGAAWLSAEEDPTPIGPLRSSQEAVMRVAEHLYGIAPAAWEAVRP